MLASLKKQAVWELSQLLYFDSFVNYVLLSGDLYLSSGMITIFYWLTYCAEVNFLSQTAIFSQFQVCLNVKGEKRNDKSITS